MKARLPFLLLALLLCALTAAQAQQPVPSPSVAVSQQPSVTGSFLFGRHPRAAFVVELNTEHVWTAANLAVLHVLLARACREIHFNDDRLTAHCARKCCCRVQHVRLTIRWAERWFR